MANVKINESLESNNNITKEVKDNIIQLVDIFEKNFPVKDTNHQERKQVLSKVTLWVQCF